MLYLSSDLRVGPASPLLIRYDIPVYDVDTPAPWMTRTIFLIIVVGSCTLGAALAILCYVKRVEVKGLCAEYGCIEVRRCARSTQAVCDAWRDVMTPPTAAATALRRP